MASPTFFARGHTPTLTDTRWFILQRILGAIIDGGGGVPGGGFQDLNGNGSPVGVVTPQARNQKYRNDLDATYYWATGLTNTDWSQYV